MKKIRLLYIILVGRLKRWLDRKLVSENEKQFRKAARDLRLRLEAAKKLDQDRCSHLAGGNVCSEQTDFVGRTSIVWHLTDTATWAGFCLNCQRQFNPSDDDFHIWFEKASFCTSSSACQRQKFGDAAAKPHDKLATFPWAYPPEDLDLLSDQEIKDLLEGVRELRKAGKQV